MESEAVCIRSKFLENMAPSGTWEPFSLSVAAAVRAQSFQPDLFRTSRCCVEEYCWKTLPLLMGAALTKLSSHSASSDPYFSRQDARHVPEYVLATYSLLLQTADMSFFLVVLPDNGTNKGDCVIQNRYSDVWQIGPLCQRKHFLELSTQWFKRVLQLHRD